MRILFIHPDLGIGGAERLVVDAALALQKKGHNVSFLTNHHDKSHCFEETSNGTIKVEVVGDWIPRNLFGRFYALFAYMKMIYAAMYVVLFQSRNENIDLVFIDLVSACIPILKFVKNAPKILFYCHFPDQLLVKPGQNFLKSLYRKPLNYIEEVTTAKADAILVNSKFTSRIFHETFKSIEKSPDVLYPSLVTKNFDVDIDKDLKGVVEDKSTLLLSINRFERKKNLELALRTLTALKSKLNDKEWNDVQLAMIGGYDPKNSENIEHFEELNEVCRDLNLTDKVVFLKSPSDEMKIKLLRRCQMLFYTPSNEHFGIVPLEAMYSRKPVIAVNSGGPTETVGELIKFKIY